MSQHIDKSIKVAAAKGAAAAHPMARPLWDLPKRELIEALLHQVAARAVSYDDALASGQAARYALDEVQTLRLNGII